MRKELKNKVVITVAVMGAIHTPICPPLSAHYPKTAYRRDPGSP